ncbi:MFS transporter [Amycolatopsis sp. NPDC051903]|uniref:MFS transporter n=1 Tax=Amycolatopsis sp. NPDC051903 TaxID=3363936 RepID=UPI0037A2D047
MPAPTKLHGWHLITAVAALTIFAEGYDIVVFGAVLPGLLVEPSWDLSKAEAGLIGSATYLGMLIGSVVSGRFVDRFGPRRILLTMTVFLALGVSACAVAGSPVQLGVFRFVLGLAVGGNIPAAIVAARSAAPAQRMNLALTWISSGILIGGAAASLIAIPVLPTLGWRALFWIGAGISLVALAATALVLPARPVRAPGNRPGKVRLSQVLRPRHRRLLTACILATTANMLVWNGMSTWLTTSMKDLGYTLTSSLQFSLLLTVSALLGSLSLGVFADRSSARTAGLLSTGIGLVGLAGCVFAAHTPGFAWVSIALLGAGAGSTTTMIGNVVAIGVPAEVRGTAFGLNNGLGRVGAIFGPLAGGWIIGATVGPTWFFVFCAAVLVLCAVALSLVPRVGVPVGDDEPMARQQGGTAEDVPAAS